MAATVRLDPRVDFHTSDAANLAGVDDLGVLLIAAREGRILVTHDKSTMPDYFAQFIQANERAGVFIVPRGLKLADIAEELVMIFEASPDRLYSTLIPSRLRNMIEHSTRQKAACLPQVS